MRNTNIAVSFDLDVMITALSNRIFQVVGHLKAHNRALFNAPTADDKEITVPEQS